MSANTEIGWTDHTWPVIRGCSKVSDGCKFCWAIRDAHLHAGNKNPKMQEHFGGLTVIENGRPNWTGVVRLDESILDWPLHWKTPARIFAASSSDLFHEDLPTEVVYRVFITMWAAHWHTFQVLTKRPERMKALVTAWLDVDRQLMNAFAPDILPGGVGIGRHEPLSNVWFGVSVEDQATVEARIPLLLQTPAALRFVSYEPALAGVNFKPWLYRCVGTYMPDGSIGTRPALDWGIVGGESGPQARPCDLAWIESTVDQFHAAGRPLFVKQLGAKPFQSKLDHFSTRYPITDSKGGNWDDWPAKLRVREFPK